MYHTNEQIQTIMQTQKKVLLLDKITSGIEDTFSNCVDELIDNGYTPKRSNEYVRFLMKFSVDLIANNPKNNK